MQFSKNCPTCNTEVVYKNKYTLNNSQKLNKSCRSCSSKKRIEKFGISDEFKAFITSDCCGEKNTFFGKKHSEETKRKIRDKMIIISSGREAPMKGRSLYQVWLEKHGKEEADIRMAAYREKQRINATGENNPMYGKPTPQGSGNGWSGWYKGWFFRSLRELSYVIRVIEANNLKWSSAESIRIPYVDWDGANRTYSPDFIINDNTLVEIKPSRLIGSKGVSLKKEAAENFCKNIGWTYELVDQPRMANKEIEDLYDSGEIKFTKRYELKFLEIRRQKSQEVQ